MAEESKLVEEVVETTESTKQEGVEDKFNPLAFAGDDVYGELDAEKETKETTSESEEQSEEQSEEDSWVWDKKEKTEEVVKEEDDYNWDNTQEKSEEQSEETTGDLTWSKVGQELGLEINSRDELINTINEFAKQSQEKTPVNNQANELKNYLNFSDRDLIAEELKADGIEDSEIEDSLDKLEDSGMMKMKAKSIRRVINNAIDQQTAQARQQLEQEKNQKIEGAENAKKELKNKIKGMSEFMGGKVTKKQKEEVYRYATGDMMKEIYADHANVADVAMFMLYRKQIETILRSQGLEDGKAAIMNSIVSPSLNTGKSKSNFKVKTGKFDPKAFMSE